MIKTSHSWNDNIRYIYDIQNNMSSTDGMLLVIDIDATIVNSNNRLICSKFGDMLRQLNARKVHVVILTMRDAVGAETTLRHLSRELPNIKFSTPFNASQNFCMGEAHGKNSDMISVTNDQAATIAPSNWFRGVFSKPKQTEIFVFFSRFKEAWHIHKQIGMRQIKSSVQAHCNKTRIITLLVDDALSNHVIGDGLNNSTYGILYINSKKPKHKNF
jgi:hypothetical protein